MNVESFTVEVRNAQLQRVGIIRPEYLTLEVSDLFNAVGTWKVTLPSEHAMAAALRTPGSGIVVTGANDFIFSGPTTQPQFSGTIDDIRGTYTFNGVSDSIALADALCYPNEADVTASVADNGVLTGTSEGLMHSLVNANIGPGALVARRKAGLSMGTNRNRGSSSAKVYRTFQSVLEALQSLATGTSLGFRIVQRGSGLVFETFETQNRTASVRLSMTNGELVGQEVSTAAPSATRAIVAGLGWATSRKVIEYTDQASTDAEAAWGRRIERYVDQRTTNVTAELQTAGAEVLTKDGGTLVGVKAVAGEDTDLIFGSDYFLGDTVTAEIRGVETQTTVTGIVLKADSNGTRFGLMLGEDIAFSSEGARTLTGLDSRVDRLERNMPQLVVKGYSINATANQQTTSAGPGFNSWIYNLSPITVPAGSTLAQISGTFGGRDGANAAGFWDLYADNGDGQSWRKIASTRWHNNGDASYSTAGELTGMINVLPGGSLNLFMNLSVDSGSGAALGVKPGAFNVTFLGPASAA